MNDEGSVMFSFLSHSAHGAAIPTGKSALAFIDGMVTNIFDRYNYHSIIYTNYINDFVAPRGDLRYILHFMSVPNCVPVLNRKKVDGIGMIFIIASLNGTLKRKNLSPVFCTVAILSNYKENIFVVDGVTIKQQIHIAGNHLLEAKGIINRSLKQTDEYSLWQNKNVVKAKDKKEISDSGWEDIKFGGSSTTTYATASPTGFYYYTSS